MKLLALDASTTALSVALLDSGGETACEHFEVAPRAHARCLLPRAADLLAEAGWTLAMLDGLAFGRGPGAFTGLRVAAGLIQGLASGLDRPVVPVSTLAAIATRCFTYSNAGHALIVQDARMGEIYTATYARRDDTPALVGRERVMPPAALEPAASEPMVRGGNGWHLVPDAGDVKAVVEAPHALDIARLAAVAFAAGHGVAAAAALPVYVRDDVARKPAHG